METILIIDDEPVGLSLLREMLDDGKYLFECAASGREVRQIVAARGTDVSAILLDWSLPDVDGLELLEWLQAQPSLAEVEVVVQSADFEPDSIERGIECGAYYYLTKPFDKAQLKAIMRAAIDTCELRRALARRVRETEDTFGLLSEGTFRLRTVKQAQLLAVHLGSAAGDPQMAVGLLELLVNAVEHGNLEIGYDKKGELLARGELEAEIARRLAAPEYRDRRVEVRVVRHSDRLEITIADAGPGFDFERYQTLDQERVFDSHGRGILLAGAALDVRFVAPGNKVEIRLPLARAAR